MVVAALCALALGWPFYWAVSIKHPDVADGVAIAATILCGVVVLIGIRNVVKPSPALVIDGSGVTVSPLRAGDKVFWSDIKDARLAEMRIGSSAGLLASGVRVKIIALDLADPEAFYGRPGRRRKRWFPYTVGMSRGYFPIRYEDLDIDADRLMSILNDRIAGRPSP